MKLLNFFKTIFSGKKSAKTQFNSGQESINSKPVPAVDSPESLETISISPNQADCCAGEKFPLYNELNPNKSYPSIVFGHSLKDGHMEETQDLLSTADLYAGSGSEQPDTKEENPKNDPEVEGEHAIKYSKSIGLPPDFQYLTATEIKTRYPHLANYFFSDDGKVAKSEDKIQENPAKKQVKRISKTQHIKKHLLDHGSITSWDAINKYGATRLSSIIYNLRNSGMVIETVEHTANDRNGNTCTFATYHHANP